MFTASTLHFYPSTHKHRYFVLVRLTFIPFPPGSWTLLPNLICQPTHHYCNQKEAQSWSLMYSSHWPAPHISLSLYIACIILKYFSIPPDFLSSPLGSLSYAFSRRQRHSVTPFVLLCISSLNTQRKHCICSIPTALDKDLLKIPSAVILGMQSFWSRPIISPLFIPTFITFSQRFVLWALSMSKTHIRHLLFSQMDFLLLQKGESES